MAIFKKDFMPLIRKNKEKLKKATEYTTMLAEYFLITVLSLSLIIILDIWV